MSAVNIVSLMENNPITKLSSDYNVRLLEKAKQQFNEMEQQLFLTSFYCYLNHHPTNDFVIDLDELWKWIGFSKKQKSLLLLEKNFILNKDYIILDSHLGEVNSEKDKWGGHNKKTILLNVTTFKRFCIKAETKKASEIHYYFLKLEEIFQEIVEEESNELKQKLLKMENDMAKIETEKTVEKEKAIEKTLIEQFPLNTECIYFGKIDNINDANETLIKFGHTNNLSKRVVEHRKTYDNFVLLNAFKVHNKVEIENCIKNHPKIKNQIRTIQINEKNKTEILAYNDSFTPEILTNCIKQIIQDKMFSIDNFNKLVKQNAELLEEVEQLKKQVKEQDYQILKYRLEINELKEQLEKKSHSLELVEQEQNTVYQNTLLSEDEQTNKFNNFIDNMCIVRPDVEESSVDLEGAYRIWNRVKPTKETFHAFKNYLDVRFKASRLTVQTKNQVVHGYKGLKLKRIDYKKKLVNNDVETFLFQVCRFSPSGKILNSVLLTEFQRWKKSLNKGETENDMKDLKEYLNNCEYVLKTTVWYNNETNEGYYGISLKSEECNHRNTASTGKKVEKVELSTGNVLQEWDTIAKASTAEHISPAKMSRSIANNVIFNDYFYRVKK